MKTREMGYSDYGFAPGEEKTLKEYCRRPDFKENILLLECAMQSNAAICSDLYYSIVKGLSWEKMDKKVIQLYGKSDFYGYQRKTLALFWNELCFLRWGDVPKDNSDEQPENGGKERYSMALSRYEQETVINFNAKEDAAELYTADPVWIRKMDKLIKQNPEQFKPGKSERYEGKVIAKRYIFPKRFVTIRSKDIERKMTEEQKRAAAERMKGLNGTH